MRRRISAALWAALTVATIALWWAAIGQPVPFSRSKSEQPQHARASAADKAVRPDDFMQVAMQQAARAAAQSAPSGEEEPAERRSGAKRREEHLEYLEQLLEREQQDRSWAPTARNELLDAYTQADPQVDVDCKASLCRVALTLSGDLEQRDERLRGVTQGAPWHGQGMLHYSGDDGRLVFFLARAGYDLPRPTASTADEG